MALPRALKPFASPAYTVLAFAMCMSVFGSGLWAVALVGRVVALGGTAVQLSMVTAAGALGTVVFVLVGGVTADRVRLTVILRGVEAVNFTTAVTLTVLTWTGLLTLWQLGVAAFVFAGALGFFYPAYSAALPRILPGEQLLAANGVEGTARPLLQTAAGPAVGGVLAGLAFPGLGVLAIACCHLAAFAFMMRLRIPSEAVTTHDAASADAAPASGASPGTETPPAAGTDLAGAVPGDTAAARRSTEGNPPGPPAIRRSALRDLADGFLYSVRTPWLLWTLLWAMSAVFLFMGPLEVLVPFLVVDELGGSVTAYGALLGLYGVSSALGSAITASLPLPRHYLTTMVWLWGFGTLPFGLVGSTDSWWVMAAALAVFGMTGGAGQVIWGTLLQRRVPIHMLGRISSLDFFVSLSLMPVSMAVAGPVSHVLSAQAIFWGVALLTPALGVVAVWAGRMSRDQAAHPLR